MKLLSHKESQDLLWHCCFSHNGQLIATCGKSREISLYTTKDLKRIDVVGNDVHDRTVRSLVFDPVRIIILSLSLSLSLSMITLTQTRVTERSFHLRVQFRRYDDGVGDQKGTRRGRTSFGECRSFGTLTSSQISFSRITMNTRTGRTR